MQFKVPQFLEIEDKIFGPFTFRQFVYLVGGAGMCYILYKLLGLLLGALPILAIAGFSLALAFYRPNSKPFIEMVQASIKYMMQSKLYIWKTHKTITNNQSPARNAYSIADAGGRITNDKKNTDENKNTVVTKSGVKLSGSKLKDLAWSLDVLDLKKG